MKRTLTTLLAAPLLTSAVLAGDIIDFGANTKLPSEATTAQLELAEDTGYSITSVTPNSPAATLGLQKNDLVVSMNGKALNNIISLSEYIASTCEQDQEITLTWNSKGEQKTGSVKLTDKLDRQDFFKRYQRTQNSRIASSNGEIPAQLQLMLQGLGGAGAGANTSVSSHSFVIGGDSSKSMTDAEHTIAVTKGENGKKHVKVTPANGADILFEGDVDPKDLSNVPEDLRKKVKSMVSGNSFDISSMIHGMSRKSSKNTEKPEKDIDDLLEGLDDKDAE